MSGTERGERGASPYAAEPCAPACEPLATPQGKGGNTVDTGTETVFTEGMTTSERISHLNTGDRVAITINNDRHERLVGRVVALLPHAVRLNTGERVVSISRDTGFISRVARVA